MENLISTLRNVVIYMIPLLIGALIGTQKAVRSRPLRWVDRLQFAALMVLVLALGVNLGANDDVISSLGEIGVAALAVTLFAMAGALGAAFLLRRFVLHLNRYGLPRDGVDAGGDSGGTGGKADNALTKWIVGAVILGMLAGRFVLPEAVTAHCGTVINLGLYLLLLMVGIGIGKQGTFFRDVRTVGFRVLLLPAAVAVGSLLGAALAGLFLPMGAKDAMAVASGMGWYSLAPTLLAPYSMTVSATAFLSNVMREIFSILAIPFAAKHIGYVECAALPGAAAMDTVLPVAVGATHPRITVYSFTSGVVLTLLVPALVPAVVGLPI